MKILRAYKTELAPNNKQCTMFRNCAGAARFVYNWALADRIERYERGLKTGLYEQKARFNELKGVEYPWIYGVPYTVQESAFRNLDTAYKNFFRRIKVRTEKPGFPRFKSRKRGIGSFTLRGYIHVEHDRIKLPRIGWVRLKERSYLPMDETPDCRVLSVTISERAGRWFVSAQIEEERPEPRRGDGAVLGVDFGLKTLVVCSDGTVFENPHSLRQAERKLARLNRELSRRTRGSQNWKKTRHRIQRQYAELANIRKHTLHQISHHLTAKIKPRVIVLENLNVAGMMQNRRLSKAISDVAFNELRQQIEYKAARRDIHVVLADRWYPSSKTCSECGAIKSVLKLSERTFVCSECGFILDRDLNAARNLAALGEPQNIRGLPVELVPLGATVKQELSSSL